jgi:hypothetical protein
MLYAHSRKTAMPCKAFPLLVDGLPMLAIFAVEDMKIGDEVFYSGGLLDNEVNYNYIFKTFTMVDFLTMRLAVATSLYL